MAANEYESSHSNSCGLTVATALVDLFEPAYRRLLTAFLGGVAGFVVASSVPALSRNAVEMAAFLGLAILVGMAKTSTS